VTGGLTGQADLHCHTTASDGTLTPEQAVVRARELGLVALAITDHDVTEGVGPARTAAGRGGPEIVPGVEINAWADGTEVHVLGYYLDVDDAGLQTVLYRLRRDREERLLAMLRRLQALGMTLDPERVRAIAGEGSVGRPHVARALVERGHVASVEEAFGRLLTPGRPAYVPRHRLSPREAIAAIRRAGGVAVLAHPGLTGRDDLIPRLVGEGLQGLEVCHPQHTPRAQARYLELARRWGLVATGGSDSHGPDGPGAQRVDIGALTVDGAVVTALKRLAKGGPT